VQVFVEASQKDYNDGKRWRIGDPNLASLRAYRSYHPSIRIYVVERNGRTVWLTWKQLMILRYVDRSYVRRRRIRLADIAEACHCSPATVSRTLVRFDLWRWVDYIAIVGRGGGAYVFTRVHKHDEQDANLARAKVTLQSRKVARTWLATRVRLLEWRHRMEDRIRSKIYVAPRVTTGSMDAMFP
jgi:ABC-type uncharacterized transport system, periplasmic component